LIYLFLLSFPYSCPKDVNLGERGCISELVCAVWQKLLKIIVFGGRISIFGVERLKKNLFYFAEGIMIADPKFEDIMVGDTASFSKTVTEADVCNFAGVTGDFNPIHMD
jgi:hypothetical protein